MLDSTPEEFKKLSSEVGNLRSELDKINTDKEFWFKKKESLKTEINSAIRDIRNLKSQSDQKNIDLIDLKKQRDKYNDEVHSLIKIIKKLNDEKSAAFKKYNIKVDPSKIQQKINELESKVEIEVNFEKEKKLMEEIKKLKKVFDDSSEIVKLSSREQELHNSIKESRKKADEFHKKIQDTAKDANYDNFLSLSAKITNLKKEQEEAFLKFIEFKDKFALLNGDFKQKAERHDMLRFIFKKDKEVQNTVRAENSRSIIDKKANEAEQKLKSGKRLTTEDLLSFQAEMKD